MYCKKKKKNKNKNKNNNNNNKKKHKNATKRCVTSCGMKRTSYCALHLRACAEYMTNTNAHTTIHNPYGIAGARSSTISKKLACSLCRIGVIISYEDVSLIYFDVDIANCLNDLQYFVCFFMYNNLHWRRELALNGPHALHMIYGKEQIIHLGLSQISHHLLIIILL